MFESLLRLGRRKDCPPVASRGGADHKLLQRVGDTIGELSTAINIAKARHQEVVDKNELLEALIYAAGGYVWLKGPDGLYKWCDHKFCEDFFGLYSRDCDVRGMSDIDLISAFRERTGKRHSYGELCLSTDQHCVEQGEQCRYIEAGYVGDELFVLDIIKTPMYHEGLLRGVVGFAWNRSDDCECVHRQLRFMTEKQRAERLMPIGHPDGSDVGVWWIKPEVVGMVCELSYLFSAENEEASNVLSPAD